MNRRILHSSERAHETRRIPNAMVWRILMVMWSFGPLYITVSGPHLQSQCKSG